MGKLKDLEMRNTAVIYSSMLSQIRKLYERDEVQAGKLAISALELVLCGEFSSDDLTIELILEPFKTLTKRNQTKWENVKESKNESRVEKLKLKQIADLFLEGLKQDKIAEKVGVSRQTVSNRLKLIRQEFPELLREEGEEDSEIESEDNLPGEYLGGTIKLSDLNKSSMEYDVVNDFAYFPSTGVRLKIVPG